MKAAVCAFLFLACVAYASSLCTPDQWEGIQSSLGGYADREKRGLIKEYMSVHYDAKNRRSAVFLDYVNNDYENKFQIIVRYDDDVNDDEGRIYVVNMKDNSCWHKKTCCPFRKACIPEDAKNLGDYYMGLEGGFKASAYEMKKWSLESVVSVQKKDEDVMIPLTETVFGRLGKVDFMQGIGFANITPGIKNATVFDIPEQCEKREDITMVEQLTREHYILAL